MAQNVVVVGTQWGDEGKGKLVDWLTETATGVVRTELEAVLFVPLKSGIA